MKGLRNESLSKSEVIERLKKMAEKDMNPLNGRMWGHVYYAGMEDVIDLARTAYLLYMDKTMLDFTVYPSILKMENDVVAITADLLNGDENVVGNFTYGGTESIMLAVKSARDYFLKVKGKSVTPEIILPSTAHPAFYKSAEFLGLKPVTIGVDEKFRADVEELKSVIGDKTAMVVTSAPNYPFGVVDDVEGIAEICLEKELWLHVDACLGGFVLPFFKMLGESIPLFDFSVEGVISISADLHKYGYAPRGASVILHKNPEYRGNHVFVMARWPGYPIVNTAVLSTRSAGTISASWAILNYLGKKGYLELAKMILKAKKVLLKELPKIGLDLIGNPEGSVVAFKSDKINVFRVSSIMAEKGWYVQSQPGSKHLSFPKSLHFSINPGHANVVDDFVRDMKIAVESAKEYEEAEIDLEIQKDIFSSLGLKEGELPENMELVNELIHAMPPEIVETIFKKIVNEVIFKPTKE